MNNTHTFFFYLSSFRREDFQKSTNQKQEWPVVAMFIHGWELNEQFVGRAGLIFFSSFFFCYRQNLHHLDNGMVIILILQISVGGKI
jgi:hypothetical protein